MSVLKNVAPHFPAPAPAVRPSPPLMAALATFNLQSARLLARFLPAAPPPQQLPAHGPAAGAPLEAPWVARLLDFYQSVLVQGRVLPVRCLHKCSCIFEEGVLVHSFCRPSGALKPAPIPSRRA